MQSVQSSVLEKQISQLFGEVISIWRESDIKKNEAVRRLAARLEEFFIERDQAERIQLISSIITQKLRDNGLEKTAHHVRDYLDDKYKRPYERGTPGQNAVYGHILPNEDIEQCLSIDPLALTHEEKIKICESIIKNQEIRDKQTTSHHVLYSAILQAAIVQHQPMNYSEDTFTSTTGQHYEHSKTDVPDEKYEGPVHKAWSLYCKSVKRFSDACESIKQDFYNWGFLDTPEDKQLENELVNAINYETQFFETLTAVHSPFKDLKYGTSTRNWWRILMRFLDHGKHAAAVMDPIQSHSKPDVKRPYTREQVGDEQYLKEQLLEKYGETRDFCNYIKDWFIHHAEKLYDKNETVLKIRKEYIGKLISLYASNPDFFNYACEYREQKMDPRVATRRDDAHDTLSGLA